MSLKQELKINKLIKIYKDNINNFINKHALSISSKNFIKNIVNADPDIQGKNTKWILNNLFNDRISYNDIVSTMEDSVYNILAKFINLKKCNSNLNLFDINKYHSLSDIKNTLTNKDSLNIISNKQLKRDIKQQAYSESIILYNKNKHLVLIPKTEKASCFWGLNTKWCTAAAKINLNKFDNYNNFGNLFIYIAPNNKKYQFHNDSYPMDETGEIVIPSSNLFKDNIFNALFIMCGCLCNFNKNEYSVFIKNLKNETYLKLEFIIKYNPFVIKDIDINNIYYNNLCLIAVSKDYECIKYIPKELLNNEICKMALINNIKAIEYIPKRLFSQEMANIIYSKNNKKIEYIPNEYIQNLKLVDLSNNIDKYKEMINIFNRL